MPTTARGISYPASTDAPRVWEDMQELADSANTALDNLDHSGTADTAIGSAAANFTAVSQYGRTALGGHLVYVNLEITSTNAITATSGNVADTVCFTVDTEYRPSEIVNAVLGANMVGEVTLNTSGQVTIRAASDTIAAGTTFRCGFVFLKA